MAKRRVGKRRGANEGSVFQRADGRWVAMLTVRYGDDNRRRRRKAVRPTQAEALEALDELRGKKRSGMLDSRPERLTVGAWLDRWLERHVKPTRRATTFETYSAFIRVHVKPRFGGVELGRLREDDVRGMLEAMEAEGRSARLRQAVFNTFRRALKDAVRARVLERSPAAELERPRVARREVRVLTPEEARRLLATAEGTPYEALIVLGAATGARMGELFGLRWGDIDLEARELRIQRIIVALRGRPTVSEPKTKAGRRVIDLPDFAVRALLAHRKALKATPHPTAWVFTARNGEPLRHSNFRRRVWEPLTRRAGVEGLRFHGLRHSFASLLLARGVHVKVTSALLGHADVTTTLDVYSHLLPGLGRQAADELEAVLGGPAPSDATG